MSGSNWIKRGSIVGTGAAIEITCGFKPVKVEFFNSTGLVTAEKTESMATSSGTKRVTAGTMTFPTGICTLNDDGFTIGTDTDLNVAAETIHWVAYQAHNS